MSTVTRDCLIDIERELIAQYRALDKYDPWAVLAWYRRVAGWLVQLPDEDTYHRWMIVFMLEICQAHVGIHPTLCGWVLDHYVEEALHAMPPLLRPGGLGA